MADIVSAKLDDIERLFGVAMLDSAITLLQRVEASVSHAEFTVPDDETYVVTMVYASLEGVSQEAMRDCVLYTELRSDDAWLSPRGKIEGFMRSVAPWRAMACGPGGRLRVYPPDVLSHVGFEGAKVDIYGWRVSQCDLEDGETIEEALERARMERDDLRDQMVATFPAWNGDWHSLPDGEEAEELRQGIDKLVEEYGDDCVYPHVPNARLQECVDELRSLTERVDARDALQAAVRAQESRKYRALREALTGFIRFERTEGSSDEFETGPLLKELEKIMQRVECPGDVADGSKG